MSEANIQSAELDAMLAIKLAQLYVEADLSARQKLCQFLENASNGLNSEAAKIVRAFITRVQIMNRDLDPPKKLIQELLA